jgi:hypothetical protein
MSYGGGSGAWIRLVRTALEVVLQVLRMLDRWDAY